MKRSQGGRGRACVVRTVRAADEDPGVEGRRLAVEPVRDAEASAIHAQTPRSGVALLVAATATAVSLVRAPHGLSPRPPPAAGWLVSGHLQLRKLVRGTRSALRAADDSTPSPSPSPHRLERERCGCLAASPHQFGGVWFGNLDLGLRRPATVGKGMRPGRERVCRHAVAKVPFPFSSPGRTEIKGMRPSGHRHEQDHGGRTRQS